MSQPAGRSIVLRRQPRTLPQRQRVITNCCLALALFGGSGCAHLATVGVIQPKLPAGPTGSEQLEAARKYLVAAKAAEPLSSLGSNLTAAKLSLNALQQQPGNLSALDIYNFSVARVVQDVERANLQPWRQPVSLTGDQSNYILISPRPIDSDHDPSLYNLFPADALKIGGKFYKKRSSVSGIGAPLVAVARSDTPRFRELHRLEHIYAPVTAVIRFSGRHAELEFIDRLKSEQCAINKHVYPLAGDFSAATAMLIVGTHPEKLGMSRVIDPDRYADTARLEMLQQFDHERTPVIFVHGLQETPASWAPMINTLRDDQWIREHYQFWFFTYPSGYPYPYSAALLRRDLDDVKRKCAALNQGAVFIGHSLGGLICRLLMTDAGDKIWRNLFGTPPNNTPLSPEILHLFEDTLIFNHRPEAKRVIFISTPHRGSDLASNWIGRFGSGLVKTPPRFRDAYTEIKPLLVRDSGATTFKRMPNSVDTLAPKDRFVRAVNKLPIISGVPYHCIMGDRGRGDTPNSSDGVVPYWSSHLEGAQSELVVPSDHGAQYNSQAIAEVARILRVNLNHKTNSMRHRTTHSANVRSPKEKS